MAVCSADESRNHLSSRSLVFRLQPTQALEDYALLRREDDGLDGGGLEQSSSLPVLDNDVSESWCPAYLTGDRHKDYVSAVLVVGVRADDQRRAFLASDLIGKRKGDQDDIAEFKAGRTRHRLDCSRLRLMWVLRQPSPPELARDRYRAGLENQ